MRRLVGLVLILAACSSPASTAGSTEVLVSADPSPLIDPDDITSGGVPRDAIPSIDDPVFAPAGEVQLDPREPVLAVDLAGESKAYPIRILIWHEIVNDEVGGTPVTVTYCPLCNSALAFEATIDDGRVLEFGTSGQLYLSNLVMYDRATESLWTQLTGRAVVGPLTGTTLERVPSRITSWGTWSAGHPEGLVLTEDTGHQRAYGDNPYVGYESTDRPFLFAGDLDPRLPTYEHVLGFAEGNDVLAVPFGRVSREAVGDHATVQVEVDGEPVSVWWSAGTASALDADLISLGRDVGSATAWDPRVEGELLSFRATSEGIVDVGTGSVWQDGAAVSGDLAGTTLEPARSVESLWFSWAAFYPQTRIEPGG